MPMQGFSPDYRPVEYRPLLPRDIPKLKALHQMCFPVQYDDRFYKWLLEPSCLSIVAVLKEVPMTTTTAADDDGAMMSSESINLQKGANEEVVGDEDEERRGDATASPEEDTGVSKKSSRGEGESSKIKTDPTLQKNDDDERDNNGNASENRREVEVEGGGKEYVVGFVIGKIKYVQGPVFSSPVAYISTFGVDPEHRERGLGNDLLERFAHFIFHEFKVQPEDSIFCFAIPRSWRSPKIRQLWLHCLASDDKIVKFYRKRQFVVVERIEEYYNFGDRPHDAYVMCREVDALQKVISDKDKSKKRRPSSSVQRIVTSLEENDELDEDDPRPAGGKGRWWAALRCAAICCVMVLMGAALLAHSSSSATGTGGGGGGNRHHGRLRRM